MQKYGEKTLTFKLQKGCVQLMDGFHYAQPAWPLQSIGGRKSRKAYEVYTGGVFVLFCFTPPPRNSTLYFPFFPPLTRFYFSYLVFLRKTT